MRRFLRIAGIVVGTIVTIALIALVVLLQGPAVPDHSDYQLDLATLRKLADQTAGQRPVKINAAEADATSSRRAFPVISTTLNTKPSRTR